MTNKTIIAGSRHITDYALVTLAVDMVSFKVSEVVSGGARGVDALGERFARENGLPLKKFPADWKKHGRRYAGFIRNKDMADYADALIAIWDGKSKGTLDMIKQAKKAGLVVRVFLATQSKMIPLETSKQSAFDFDEGNNAILG